MLKPNYEGNQYFDLEDIPLTIRLNGEDFHIGGCIAFQPQNDHFYAIAFTDNNWVIYDDLKTKPESVKQTRHLIRILIYRI